MSKPVSFETHLEVIEKQRGERHVALTVDVDATWDSQDQAVTEFTVESGQGAFSVPVWAIMSSLTDALDQEMRKMKIITIQQVMEPDPPPAPFTIREAFAIQQILEAVQGNHKVTFSTDGGANIQEGIARRIGDEAGNSLPDTDIRDQFVWITTVTGFELFLPVRQAMELVRDLLFVMTARINPQPLRGETGGKS